MRLPRVTIASLMGLTALTACGFAALQRPTPIAASVAFSLSVAACLAAVVAALCATGRPRAAWASFALCGAVYLALSLGPWMAEFYGVRPITVPLIECLAQLIRGEPHVVSVLTEGASETIIASPSRYWTAPIWASGASWNDMSDLAWTSLIILHSSIALAFATAGGLFSLALSRQNRIARPRVEDVTDTPTRGGPCPPYGTAEHDR
jgi:hypothetical protein